MSQYSELEELKAVFATQYLLVFESVEGVSERLGDEFDKGACFQKPTTVNEIEQRERDRIFQMVCVVGKRLSSLGCFCLN